jgi:hypothetical protein
LLKLSQGLEAVMRRSGFWRVVAAVALATLAGCQKLKDDEPPAPTGPSEVSSPTGSSDAVLGSVPDAPAPTPTPDQETPDPAPTPDPQAPPTSSSCHLPPSAPANPSCSDASPLLEAQVEAALDTVTERFPELFDFADTRCENCYFVKDVPRYFDEVIKQLKRQSLCTDGVREELGIKSSNDFSEQYDIILVSEHMRRAPGAYRGVCRPAIF